VTEAVCGQCGERFVVARDLVGGITNCPRCGRAVEVEGLNDPLWRMAQVGAAIFVAVVGAVAYGTGGVIAAVVAVIVSAGVLWLVSRAL